MQEPFQDLLLTLSYQAEAANLTKSVTFSAKHSTDATKDETDRAKYRTGYEKL
jgi:hypothetical protein